MNELDPSASQEDVAGAPPAVLTDNVFSEESTKTLPDGTVVPWPGPLAPLKGSEPPPTETSAPTPAQQDLAAFEANLASAQATIGVDMAAGSDQHSEVIVANLRELTHCRQLPEIDAHHEGDVDLPVFAEGSIRRFYDSDERVMLVVCVGPTLYKMQEEA